VCVGEGWGGQGRGAEHGRVGEQGAAVARDEGTWKRWKTWQRNGVVNTGLSAGTRRGGCHYGSTAAWQRYVAGFKMWGHAACRPVTANLCVPLIICRTQPGPNHRHVGQATQLHGCVVGGWDERVCACHRAQLTLQQHSPAAECVSAQQVHMPKHSSPPLPPHQASHNTNPRLSRLVSKAPAHPTLHGPLRHRASHNTSTSQYLPTLHPHAPPPKPLTLRCVWWPLRSPSR
jgi:hypothetical protein